MDDDQLIAGWRAGDRRCGDALARRYTVILERFFRRQASVAVVEELT